MSNVSPDNVAGATRNILSDLSTQADGLVSFFNTAKTTYPALAGRFESLRAEEQQIKNRANTVNKSSTNNTLAAYTNNIETRIDAILGDIFTGQPPVDLENFKKYYKAYQDGRYLVIRDWNASGHLSTGASLSGSIEVGDTGSTFGASLSAIGKGYGSVNGGQVLEARSGISFKNLAASNYTALMNEIKAEMQTRIINALGLSGVSNASQMADALITQMGDNAEFDAFIDDVVKQGTRLSTALNYTGYAVASYNEVAGVQTQSDVKLAHISPDVDLTKGAFTPYRKENGSEIA
jgi:hypothetical protein